MKAFFFLFALASGLFAADRPPNVIIIFTDDQGYNDLSCFGSKTIHTPHLDRLATEGRKFTSFYVTSPVCSPSRSSLLTASYPKRVGMHEHVLFPGYRHGLNPAEYSIADHFSAHGYATACYGKWHLGHHPETMPTAHGFDHYYGIPYSNDMSYPDNKGLPRVHQDEHWLDPESTVTKWGAPLFEDTKLVEHPVDQRTITRRYTDRAIAFMEENKERPFFLYLPHSMPHIPLYVPEDVQDPDPKNAYKCVIEHIDAEVGRLVARLEELGLGEDTILLFTSDNGPWLRFKHHAGKADPLRAGKSTTFEGGQRVPAILWAPGRLPAGSSSDEILSTLEVLPSFAAITETPLPDGLPPIDGLDASGTFFGDKPSPREEFLYYSSRGDIEGIRRGDWKLLRKKRPKSEQAQILLFNLAEDIGERNNLAEKHPELVAELQARMLELDEEIEANARPVLQVSK